MRLLLLLWSIVPWVAGAAIAVAGILLVIAATTELGSFYKYHHARETLLIGSVVVGFWIIIQRMKPRSEEKDDDAAG